MSHTIERKKAFAFVAINKHSHVIELDGMSLHAIKFSRSEIQIFQLKMGFKNPHMSVMSQIGF